MKFVALSDFDFVSQSLNFTTPDQYVLGGCDLYTTKAAGSDKKLYKNVENGLEQQYESNLQFSRSLSPPQQFAMAESLNLSRSSPFGNLGQVSARRTYAYLIATLNASHPDYDFSAVLRPGDFKRERSLRQVINIVDSTLYNLRPKPFNNYSAKSDMLPTAATSGSQPAWGPIMWKTINDHMSLKECSIYRYAPEESDPFEDDEPGYLWGMKYFFFNRLRKRVCYLYLRGVSILAQQGNFETPFSTPMKEKTETEDDVPMSPGARKRAIYWLGDRAETSSSIDDQLSRSTPEPAESFQHTTKALVSENGDYILSDDDMISNRSQSTMRAFSEEIVGPIEV